MFFWLKKLFYHKKDIILWFFHLFFTIYNFVSTTYICIPPPYQAAYLNNYWVCLDVIMLYIFCVINLMKFIRYKELIKISSLRLYENPKTKGT